MNRPIKFRAWDKDLKRYLYNDFLGRLCDFFAIIEGTPSRFRKLEQFTGLLDKNGKEVYEGDLIDMTQRLDDYQTYAEIIWDNEESCWGYRHKDGEDNVYGNLMDLNMSASEVIGNIYENPSLLN